jgi:myo-inositol catabolism protein IolC
VTEGFTGFAVGRTIWWDALRAFTADGDADAAVRAVTARYLDLVRSYRAAI